MDEEIALREALKTLNNASSGYNPTGHWPDLREPNPKPCLTTLWPIKGDQYTVVVNKKTHRIRFESETESSVAIVVEPKE